MFTEFLFGVTEKLWKQQGCLHDIGNVMPTQNGYNCKLYVIHILPQQKMITVFPSSLLPPGEKTAPHLCPRGPCAYGKSPERTPGSCVPASELQGFKSGSTLGGHDMPSWPLSGNVVPLIVTGQSRGLCRRPLGALLPGGHVDLL